MKPHENGYIPAMHHRPLTDALPAAHAMRTAAAVVGVVVLVLTLLAAAVYAVVVVDLIPQMH